MSSWHDQDDFWDTWSPILFTKEKWDEATKEVDNIITLLDIKSDAHILDLCCGPGRHSLEFAQRSFKVTGVDRTTKYLDKAREKAKAHKIPWQTLFLFPPCFVFSQKACS